MCVCVFVRKYVGMLFILCFVFCDSKNRRPYFSLIFPRAV